MELSFLCGGSSLWLAGLQIIILIVRLRPPSLSESTVIIFNMELTRLGSETSIYKAYITLIESILNKTKTNYKFLKVTYYKNYLSNYIKREDHAP